MVAVPIVQVVVLLFVVVAIEDLRGVVIAIGAQSQGQCTSFLKAQVVAPNLQLDVVHGLCTQAAVLEEEEESSDLVQLKASAIARLIQSGLELDAILGQGHLVPGDVEELLQSLSRQVLVLLTECGLQCRGQVLDT